MKRPEPGQVTFVVMSEAATREPHRLIAATVGVAIPRDRDLRLPVRAPQLRRERGDRWRLRRRSSPKCWRRRSARVRSDKSWDERRKSTGHESDCPNAERHPDRGRRQEGTVVHRRPQPCSSGRTSPHRQFHHVARYRRPGRSWR
jgi:hypothetical protein